MKGLQGFDWPFKAHDLMTSMAYSTISLLTNNLIMIKENANYYYYKCATVINAVHSSLSPFTSRENGVVLHKSGSNFPLVRSFK